MYSVGVPRTIWLSLRCHKHERIQTGEPLTIQLTGAPVSYVLLPHPMVHASRVVVFLAVAVHLCTWLTNSSSSA